MAPTTTIHDLPTELIWMIVGNLDIVSRMHLRGSCADINNRICPPTRKELIEFESTPYGFESGLFACANCIRLLPKEMFAENLTVHQRAKRRSSSTTRFCLECGTYPDHCPPLYSVEDHITIKSKLSVVCHICCEFKEGKAGERKGTVRVFGMLGIFTVNMARR
ncbi:uncharacterized protein N7500_003894 [Penicillium coprophilum]|uniref:uncharacterized protein n=1 Tax=Penicillium coprophilum TaxID=36646 RepID=UPI00238EB57F|nr:uncharacterized protein N7500_003894 [Penicillium coprophilum]KAJ5171111.1 hypothetical protein N7500_003894 [Penicillium coprophilum]